MSSLTRSEESLLNEYKGNVFEFLVGQTIAKEHNLEAAFLKGLNPDLLKMLETQQRFIQQKAPYLLRNLPTLANKLSCEILETLHIDQLNRVEQCGKIALGTHYEELGEADLILYSDKQEFPISIKLNKAGSYINTKSAGLKSFLPKYFQEFSESEGKQIELNHFIELGFTKVLHQMHDFYGLRYEGSVATWKEKGLPVLPGELPEELKMLLHNHYYDVSIKIHSVIRDFISQDKNKIKHCLFKLMGASHSKIVHANCLYKKNSEEYEFESCDVLYLASMSNGVIEIQEKKESASVEVIVDSHILQLRVKPMNTFINGGFKLNCSIRPLDRNH
jgi:hypothetical protein